MGTTLAKWVIQREPRRGNGALKLFYDNLVTGKRYLLGEQASDVPDEMVVEWVLLYGGPGEHDLIVLSDGNELLYTKTGLRVYNDTVKLGDGRTISLDRRAAA